jgi:hypothetical protein
MRYDASEARLEVSDVDGELVVLNLDDGCYYAIEGIGADIWGLVEAGATRDTVVSALKWQYDMDHEKVRLEVASFLDKLVDEDLLIATEIENSPAAAPDYAGWRPHYAPAIIARYDDLSESFALDPPLIIGYI